MTRLDEDFAMFHAELEHFARKADELASTIAALAALPELQRGLHDLRNKFIILRDKFEQAMELAESSSPISEEKP